MEAAPRLPMICFALKASTENVSFGPYLKKYIANFYNEDPESYTTEIYNLEGLREAAVRPTVDVAGCQLLKKYYCQLHFLKSRFPLEESQAPAVSFSWKDTHTNMCCCVRDIRFELMCILYNIGALHSQLGNSEVRSSPDGMKMACTHFQCAAWAFQTVKEKYYQTASLLSSLDLIHFMQQVCLAQAQECILEKSMLDNRKATIIAKVAVQVHDYYRQSLAVIQPTIDDGHFRDLIGGKTYKEWVKYLEFKVAYHKCISLLFQGQQAEEQQKMGERVSFYQAACDQLEEARKMASNLKHLEITEALAFTSDVVEGKRKAAKNENEFIYHEEVPDKDALQEVKGASLVKGIPFSVNDVEVSGPDIFAKLVPMEAHEASSLYSEKKAQMLRELGELVEKKDQDIAEFVSSMELDLLTKMKQATGIPQELIDRAAALSGRPTAMQDLVEAMGKLSNIYHDVEAMLKEIDELLKEEEQSEKEYQELIGSRPPSIIATDLAREAAKYREAHTKANNSNQTLHKAMTAHVANLKILSIPLRQLQQQLPSVELPNAQINTKALQDLESLVAKVEEMRTQRAMLWAQLREAVHKDDVTGAVVTKQGNQSLEELFQQELKKHEKLVSLIKQNAAAQANIKDALVETYAASMETRRFVRDIILKRSSTISALITSYDSYDDLLTKANKGIEFYTKLCTNVTKLVQRIRSASKVQQEEREQMLSRSDITKDESQSSPSTSTTPRLRDYLESRKKKIEFSETAVNTMNVVMPQEWPQGVRPAPLGSEVNYDHNLPSKIGLQEFFVYNQHTEQQNPGKFCVYNPPNSCVQQNSAAQYSGRMSGPSQQPYQSTNQQGNSQGNQDLNTRFEALSVMKHNGLQENPCAFYMTKTQNTCSPHCTGVTPSYSPHTFCVDTTRAYTTTTNTYQPISSYMQNAQPTPGYAYTNVNYGMISHTQPGNASANYPTASYNNQTYMPGYSQQQQGMNYCENQVPTCMPQQHEDMGYPPTRVPTCLPGCPGPQTVQELSYFGPEVADCLPGCPGPTEYQVSYGNTQFPMTTISGPQTSQGTSMEYTNLQYLAVQTTSYNPQGMQPQAPQQQYQHIQQQPFSCNTYYPSGYSPNYPPQPTCIEEPADCSSDSAPCSDIGYNCSQYRSSVNPRSYPTPSVKTTYTSPAIKSPRSSKSRKPLYMSSTGANDKPSIMPRTLITQGTIPEKNSPYTVDSPYSNLQGQDSRVCTNLNCSASQQSKLQGTGTPECYNIDCSSSAYSNLQTRGLICSNINCTGSAINLANDPSAGTLSRTASTSKGASNVDLLTGLDFSVSQAPLVPMQKKERADAGSDAMQSPDIKVEVMLKVVQRPKSNVPAIMHSKALNNPDVRMLFVQEIDKFEKFVKVLNNKTLSGPTNLDLKWKEIKKDVEGQKKVVSVARCYPMKNRFPDILPYDHSRVELAEAKDDYINASYIRDLSPYAPIFIATQAPLSSTFSDFWVMIREQQVELICCLLNDHEVGQDVYWPTDKGKDLTFNNLVISLKSAIAKPHWTERLISITMPEKRDTWVVVHLQFTSWPGSLFPTTPEPFVSFITEIISLHQQQKNTSNPIVVHCSSGIGRSGLVCLLISAILEATNKPASLPDLAAYGCKLCGCRKNMLRDREHLKFAYEAFLQYMRQMVTDGKLKKLNELEGHATLDGKQNSTQQTTQEEVLEKITDPLSNLDAFWANKKK